MEKLYTFCAQYKLPVTHQKMIIYKVIEGNTKHPTLEDVYIRVKKKLPTISKATVYKNIKKFAEIGLIHIIKTGDVMRIDPNIKEHHHVIDEKTGKITDVYLSKDIPVPRGIKKKDIKKIIINYYI